MLRYALLLLLQLPMVAFAQHSKASQAFKPIETSGFNHDVIAENAKLGALGSTTTEMDAFDPSNFVLFSNAFAKGKNMSAPGLPDNGRITYRNKVYQLKKYDEPNALYLLKGAQGVLSFSPPVTYDVISLLGFATEGNATFSVTFLFSDGTMNIKSKTFPDWFDGLMPVMKGMGRVKREGIANPYYEGPPENPRLYEVSIEIPERKELRGLMIRNISGRDIDQSNRVVILAVSGYNRPTKPVDDSQLEDSIVSEPVVQRLTELADLPVEVGVRIRLNNVLFKQSKAALLDQSYATLDSVSTFLVNNPTIRVEVAGHTDGLGHPRANVTLSMERAVEIKKYLVKKGVTSDRIVAKGYGGSRPVAPNDTEEHRRLNRRVEFVILSK